MPFPRRLFLNTASTTPATVFTNTAGQTTTLESVTVANPSTGSGTTVRLSIGADATGTRVLQYPIPAGVYTQTFYPNQKITSTETFQLSSTDTNNVVVVTGDGFSEVSS